MREKLSLNVRALHLERIDLILWELVHNVRIASARKCAHAIRPPANDRT